MYSNTSRFRDNAHLASVDFSDLVDLMPREEIDNRLQDDPDFRALNIKVTLRLLTTMLSFPVTRPLSERLEALVSILHAHAVRIENADIDDLDDISFADTNQLALIFENAEMITKAALPRYLQMISEGEVLYALSQEYEGALCPRNLTVGEAFAGRAYEIRFQHPQLCRAMQIAYGNITGKDDLRGVSLRDAAVIMEVTSHFLDQPGGYYQVDFSLLFPKQKGKTARSFFFRIGAENPSSLVRDNLGSLSHEANAEMALSTEDLDFILTCLTASADIASGTLVKHAPINPYAIIAARAANAGLAASQRKRAQRELIGAPNIAFTPVARVGETPLGLKDFMALSSSMKMRAAVSAATPQKWRSSIAYAEEIAICDDPRARNPHGQMHPQTIEAVFPALGRDSIALHKAAYELPKVAAPEATAVSFDAMQVSIRQSTMRSLNALMAIYNSAVQNVPLEDRPADMLGIQQMLTLHEALIDYRKAGAQCFLLNGDAEQLMAKTDIAAIAVTDLKMPFDALYLTFENKVQIVLDGEPVFLEGAYLSGSTREIAIHMVFQRTETPAATIADLCPSVTITLPRRTDLTLDAAILEAIETGGYDLECTSVTEATPDDLEAAEARGISIVPIDETSQTKLARRNERVFDSMVDALTVIANSMMLMTTAPDEITIRETWAGVSKDAAYLLNSPTAKGRAKGRKAAQRENAMPVRIIDLSTAAKKRFSDSLAAVRKSPEEAYWRRGHWRMQAYGKGRALRKWKWIEAVLCNEGASLKRAGSVYVASTDKPCVE